MTVPTSTTVFTVGHSTRSLDELLDLLRGYHVDRLVDIRTIPRSWHNPQFNADRLSETLGRWGIGYVHMKDLGGLRRPRPASANTGWRNASFRGYADYMQTGLFRQGLDRLIAMAAERRVAVMCAEAVPWRCHRSLLADALTTAGVEVRHIISAGCCREHAMTSFAHVSDGAVSYPEQE